MRCSLQAHVLQPARARVAGMMSAVLSSLPLDAACDQFTVRRLMFDRLPPRLSRADAAHVPADEAAWLGLGLANPNPTPTPYPYPLPPPLTPTPHPNS